jgi:hypothetical protein
MRFGTAGELLGTPDPRPAPRAVDESLAGNWAPDSFRFERLDPRRLEDVRVILETSRSHGGRVIAYLPPFHPRALARYRSESRFDDLRASLLAQLAAWARDYPLQFHDFSDVLSFGGGDDSFSDAAHPSREAGRLMLERMAAGD